MSAKEAGLLDELRRKELKSVSDKDFKAIRNQVENEGIRSLKGAYAQAVFAALRDRDKAMEKATSVKVGDMVSWDSSGGTARGKVEHVMREGVLGVPKSKFSIKAEPDDPAVLIRIYRDDKETETLVGHKMSTLRKSAEITKHGNHDQRSHGKWAGDSEGEYADTQGLHKPHLRKPDDSEGEFEDTDDDMEAMDMMDILRPPRITPSQRITGDFISPYSIKPSQRNRG